MRKWKPMETAPYNTAVEIKAGGMAFKAIFLSNVSIDESGKYCDQWQAVHEGKHPPCWTDGACWESNDDEMMSIQPTHWRSLP